MGESEKIKTANKIHKHHEKESEKRAFQENQKVLREKYEQQEFMKARKSRESSTDRAPSRSISPNVDQKELRQRYEHQEAERKKLNKEEKREEQEKITEVENELKSHQALLMEKYEKQEWMKEKASREASRERSSTSLPRCIS